MAVERLSGTGSLVCPLCGNDVGRSGCVDCHLSVAEIARHRVGSLRRAKGRGRRVWGRFIGLVVYAGLVAWSWYFMPTVFLFMLPGAIVGAYLHSVRGRPIIGAIACFTIVVIVPVLLWTAGLTARSRAHDGLSTGGSGAVA